MKNFLIHVDAGGSDHSQLYIARACLKFVTTVRNDVRIILYVTADASVEIGKRCQHECISYVICNTELRNEDNKLKTRNQGTTMWQTINGLYQTDADNLKSAALVFGNVGHVSLIALGFEKTNAINLPSALIASIMKNRIMLDVGNSISDKSEHLIQRAMIAEAFLESFYNLDSYKIGFLNIGAEKNKGKTEICEAASVYQQLRPDRAYGINGFIEPNEILEDNDCNAIICSGFDGNFVLKSMKGVVNLAKKTLSELPWIYKFLAYPALRHLKRSLNYDGRGGALLSRFKRPIIKSHGNSKEYAIINSLNVICDLYLESFDKFYSACQNIHEEVNTASKKPGSDTLENNGVSLE